MKLVETDIPTEENTTSLPRPPRRRVAVSLILTVSMLGAMVGTVYAVFPARNNEILSIAIRAHQEPETFALKDPSPGEVRAWTVGVLEKPVPWPALDSVVPKGTRTIKIFRRPVAQVQTKIGEDQVTLFAMRARDAIARNRKKVVGDLLALSWRKGKWTLIAVGPKETAARWRATLGR